MPSLQRLLNLARKTGNGLIIHDEHEGKDMVLLPLEEYEMLIDQQTTWDEEVYNEDLMRESSEGEYIRTSEEKDVFDRGYNAPWTQEEPAAFRQNWQDTGNIIDNRYDVQSFTNEHKQQAANAVNFVQELPESVRAIHPNSVPQQGEAAPSYEQYESVHKTPSWEDDNDPVFLEEPIPF